MSKNFYFILKIYHFICRIHHFYIFFLIVFLKFKFKTKKYTSKAVKSSNGITEIRFLIATEINIFGQLFPIELTLTERNEMKFPILLGRKFLNKKFIIDTTKKNLSYKLKNKNECAL